MMAFYKYILITLCIITCVESKATAFASARVGPPLFDPCNKNDMKCLENATKNFVLKTYGGFSRYGLMAIDPFILPVKKIVADDELGLVFYFKNALISGMRHIKFSTFNMDTDKQSVLLKTNADITVNCSDFQAYFTKFDKTFHGVYSVSATIFHTSQYKYTLKNIGGMEYFDVGPESNTCEIIEDPKVTRDGGLSHIFSTDQDAICLKPQWESRKLTILKKTLCEITKSGFEMFINNIRMLTKALPKSAFFLDI